MAPKYRPVYPAVWDSKFAGLSKEAKIMAFYVWTGPPGTSEGLYRMPLHYAAGDTGLTLGEIDRALTELARQGYVSWHSGTQTVLDRLALKLSPLRNGRDSATGEIKPDKRIPGAIRKLEEIPDHPLLMELYELAFEYSPDFAVAMVERFPIVQGSAKGLPSPTTDTSKGRVEKRRDRQLEQVHERETEEVEGGTPQLADRLLKPPGSSSRPNASAPNVGESSQLTMLRARARAARDGRDLWRAEDLEAEIARLEGGEN